MSEGACPHCKEPIFLSLKEHGKIGDRTTMRITYHDGSIGFDARSLGRAIEAYAKAIEETARCLGERACVYVTGVSYEGNAIDVDFICALKERKDGE